MTKPLLETSRNGYLAAISASSYSYISLLKNFIPIMNPGMTSIIQAFYTNMFVTTSCPVVSVTDLILGRHILYF